MKRELPVRFREGLGVKFPRATRLLLGFIGPKAEALDIKQKLAAFLRDELKLELSEAKTLVTHARDQTARFLGYEVHAQHADCKHDHRGSGQSTWESAFASRGTW